MLHDPGRLTTAKEGAVARAAAVAAAHAEAVDRDARFPAEGIDALKAEGLLGAMVPRALGGHGATLAEIAGQCQRLGEACAATAMIFAMHQIQVACVVSHGLGTAWFEALARRIAGDQLLVASITSEVGIGGDMRSSLCAIERSGERFTLSKQGPTISYGAEADLFLATARAHGDAPASDQRLVAIPRDGCRMSLIGEWNAMGMRGTCSTGFVVEAEGDAAQILPAPFAEIAAETMTPVSHLLWGGVWTGIAAEALTRARRFLRAKARGQAAVPGAGASRLMAAIGLIESAQARLAVLLAAFDATHALGSDRAIVPTEDGGWPVGLACATTLNMLKHDVATLCHQAVLEAMLVCGMAGYRNGGAHSVARHLRDILSAQLMIGNDRIAATTGPMLVAQRAPLGRL